MTVEGRPTVPAPREQAPEPAAQRDMAAMGVDYFNFLNAPGRVVHRIGEAITHHLSHRRTDTR